MTHPSRSSRRPLAARTPAELHVLFRDAFNARDVDALLSLYERSATLIIRGERVSGHTDLRAALHSLVSSGGEMYLETRSVVEGAAGLALLRGEWLVRRITVEGGPQSTRGISVEVARRQLDRSWRFVFDDPYASDAQPEQRRGAIGVDRTTEFWMLKSVR